MNIAKDGSFTFNIDAEDLSKGLRSSVYSPRNKKYLTECIGAIGYEGALQAIEDISNLIIDTSLITNPFPYPQIFIGTTHIVICGQTDIYELVADSLVHKLTVEAGIRWSAIDFYNYIYLSNGKVSVTRDALSGTYTLSDLPITSTICDFNGQVMIGAPGIEWT